MLSTKLLIGQEHITTTITDVPKRFKVGDMYYATSYKGLKLFMRDLQIEDPSLYSKLTPTFSDIEKKIKTAKFAYISAGIVGTTLVIGGLTFLQKDKDFFKPGEAFYENNRKEPNMAVIGAGLGVYLVGGIIGLLVSPGESDIYNFINLHNKNNPHKKMDWEIGFNHNKRQEFGLKLTMKF